MTDSRPNTRETEKLELDADDGLVCPVATTPLVCPVATTPFRERSTSPEDRPGGDSSAMGGWGHGERSRLQVSRCRKHADFGC